MVISNTVGTMLNSMNVKRNSIAAVPRSTARASPPVRRSR